MKPILEIIRLEEKARYGTFGVLRINKELFCYTLEPPDMLNQRRASSIPAQQYTCHPYDSPKFGKTWIVRDVPGRDGILFHPGNVIDNTEGCIILGEKLGKLEGDRAVLNSGYTFHIFLGIMQPYGMASLTILECY